MMNKHKLAFVFIQIILTLCLPICSLSERNVTDGMTRKIITDTWGKPILYGNTVCIYHHGDQFLIAAFNKADDPVSDYIIIDSARTYIEGTIDRSFTIDFVLHNLFHHMDAMIDRSYDNGSGTTVHTVMTSDGYVVEWITENAYSYWFLFGGDCQIIDSISTDHSTFAYQTPSGYFIKHHIMHID